MTSTPNQEPATTLAVDLVRAQLDGNRAAVADVIVQAHDRGLPTLIDLIASVAQLAITYGQRAHGNDLAEHLRHTTAHTLGLMPLPEHPTADAARDLHDPDQETDR